jgi:hypothetical protein
MELPDILSEENASKAAKLLTATTWGRMRRPGCSALVAPLTVGHDREPPLDVRDRHQHELPRSILLSAPTCRALRPWLSP